MSIPCFLCPRRCGAIRQAHSGEGFCGMGMLPVVARAAPHFGEEPCISGTRGSGTVFFCGCTMRCVFCQNAEISHGHVRGETLDAQALGRVFASLVRQGVHNINLVTATHFIPAVSKALRRYPPGVPVVYNSGGYELPQTLRLLDGLVDVYLPDFKFIDHDTAVLCAGAPDYPDTALSAIREMRRLSGPAVFDDDGILRKGTLVRHLVLPGLTGASMRLLTRLRETLPDVPVSLMCQYTPYGEALRIQGLDRPLLLREYARVAAHMRALDLGGYVQEMGASGTDMIPKWDLTGLR